MRGDRARLRRAVTRVLLVEAGRDTPPGAILATCDPYHVKVVRVKPKALLDKSLFELTSPIAPPGPGYLSFFIVRARCSALTVAYRSTMRRDFQPPS